MLMFQICSILYQLESPPSRPRTIPFILSTLALITIPDSVSGIHKAVELTLSDTGIPAEWQKIPDDNGITRAEQEEDPDKVLAIVQNFQDHEIAKTNDDEVWTQDAQRWPSTPPVSDRVATTFFCRHVAREQQRWQIPLPAHTPSAAPPPPAPSAKAPVMQAERVEPPIPPKKQQLPRLPPSTSPAIPGVSQLDRSASRRLPSVSTSSSSLSSSSPSNTPKHSRGRSISSRAPTGSNKTSPSLHKSHPQLGKSGTQRNHKFLPHFPALPRRRE